MAQRAAIVTGASSGIGLAIAHMLGEEGYALTVAARRPEKLERRGRRSCATTATRSTASPANLTVRGGGRPARRRRATASASAGSTCWSTTPASASARRWPSIQTKRVDMQLDLNLRSIILFYRECVDLLRAAGAEHERRAGRQHLLDRRQVAGRRGCRSTRATKVAVVGWTQAMNKELNAEGIKSCALCPGFVDTPMTEFVEGGGSPAEG